MSLELCILASGSAGNCSVLRSPAGTVLIDAGIGPRTLAKRLIGTGATIADVSAICLTHLDHDHFSKTWFNALLARNIRLFCHAPRVRDLMRHAKECFLDHPEQAETLTRLHALLIPFDAHPFDVLPGLCVRAIPLAHDREGSHGFVFECAGARLGYATDLGRVPDTLLDAFTDLDLLAIEANYDPAMQMSSGRPWFLKQRIMGGAGHLSNAQALWAIRHLLDRAESRRSLLPDHIVLLHRSRDCNCPNLMRRLFSADERIASRLTLAEQYQRTDWLRVQRDERDARRLVGEQLSLAW